jgi:branched-chain amino acid aminotransferase
MTEAPKHRIWHDGELIPWRDAKIHVLSHVVHYGSSVFEGIRCYDGPEGPSIFRLPDHMRRFLDSARIYRMPIRYSVEELSDGCIQTVAGNSLRECYLRPIAIRTGEQMGVDGREAPVETFIIPWSWGRYLGEDALTAGVDVCVSTWRRAAPDTFPALAKSGGNYLSSQLARMEARINGYSEGVMLDSFGYVSEGTGENLFVVRDRALHTPPLASGILAGLTRDSVIRIARHLGFVVVEEQIPREFLYVADELFFTGTAAEITPIRSVDRVTIGDGSPGEITLAIQTEYLGLARGTIPDQWGWRTVVPTARATAARPQPAKTARPSEVRA